MRPSPCGGFSRWTPWSPLRLAVTITTTALCFSLRPSLGLVTRRLGQRLFHSAGQKTIMLSTGKVEDATDHHGSTRRLRFCDIGANLLDARFVAGTYHGTVRHASDLDLVWQRAVRAGCDRIVLTAGTVEESRRAVQTARAWNAAQSDTQSALRFACTVGVHPTRCKQVFVDDPERDADSLLDELLEIAQDGMKDGIVVAIGEIGLDYDRLQFCPADIQQEYLQRQLARVAQPTGLPLFLHNRSVGDDLHKILLELEWKNGGVVHSFDDTLELATKFMELGLFIGLNGCSLRTEENLQTARSLPLERLLLETDCPYCEIRKPHAGYKYIQTHFPAKAEKKFERGSCVKSRQEPCHIVQVAEIIAGCKGIPLQAVAEACYQNSHQLFGWKL